jgi:hypothetical protein
MGGATGSCGGEDVGQRVYPFRLGLRMGGLGRVCYCGLYVCIKPRLLNALYK